MDNPGTDNIAQKAKKTNYTTQKSKQMINTYTTKTVRVNPCDHEGYTVAHLCGV